MSIESGRFFYKQTTTGQINSLENEFTKAVPDIITPPTPSVPREIKK